MHKTDRKGKRDRCKDVAYLKRSGLRNFSENDDTAVLIGPYFLSAFVHLDERQRYSQQCIISIKPKKHYVLQI